MPAKSPELCSSLHINVSVLFSCLPVTDQESGETGVLCKISVSPLLDFSFSLTMTFPVLLMMYGSPKFTSSVSLMLSFYCVYKAERYFTEQVKS